MPLALMAARALRVALVGALVLCRPAASLKGSQMSDEEFSEEYQPEELFWLHVPKCGSSFGTTLYHYGCPKIPSDAMANCTISSRCKSVKDPPRIGKNPLPVGYKVGSINYWYQHTYPPEKYCLTKIQKFFGFHTSCDNKNCPDKAVTVLRKPSQRIISAFHAGFFVPRIKLSDRRDIWKTVRTAADFLRSPPAQSCATKMILGYNCGSRVNLTNEHIQEAKDNLLRFKFVGITERWDDTVLLFHAMLGGHPVNVELLNNRQHYSPTQESPSKNNDSQAPAPLWHESVIINDEDMVVADGKVWAVIRPVKQVVGPVKSTKAAEVWFEALNTPKYSSDGRYDESVLEGEVDAIDEEIYSFAYELFEKNFAIHYAKIQELKQSLGLI